MFFRGVRNIAAIATLSSLTGYKIYSDAIDTHKLLIQKSREKLGVYVWGTNETGLISADTKNIKEPVPLKYFDGQVLKSLHFAKDHAAAIDSNGNLIQWGNLQTSEPNVTLTGKNLVQVICTENRVFCLSKSGTVYQVSRSEFDKKWISSLESQIAIASRQWFEKIVSISGGDDFIIGLSSHGNVFELDQFENKNSNWKRIEMEKVKQIATGSSHSLFLTVDGKIYTKGWNRFGQLGLTDLDIGIKISKPREISFRFPRDTICSQIAAGGNTSFFVLKTKDVEKVYSCGNGQFGQLGSGGFYHAQGILKPVRNLSNLQEYSEKEKKLVAIPISSIQISTSHCSAIIGSDTMFGKDVMMWGQREALARLDEKQCNTPTPEYSKPLFKSIPTDRLQLAPLDKVKGHWAEQKIALGHGISAVYFQSQ